MVLPIELRRTLDIAERDALEIYVDQDAVILKKYVPACVFCGGTEEVMQYKNKNICSTCLQELKQL